MKRNSKVFAPLVIALATLAFLRAAEPPRIGEAPHVPEAVREAMEERRYDEAVERIDKLLAGAAENADYLAYLKGRALHLAGMEREAIETFARFDAELAESPWARRARFGQAAALIKLGEFQAAEEIYEAEVKTLLSTERKQEIASIYLEFADAYFQPADREKKPQYDKALAFYRQALAVGVEPDRRIEVEFRSARCHQELGQHAEAAAAYTAFLSAHAKSRLDIEARYQLGVVELAQGQNAAARKTWKDLLDAYPADQSERLAEAAFAIAHTHGLPQPPSRDELELGVAAAERFIARFADHPLAPRAALETAQGYAAHNEPASAVGVLRKLLADPRYAKSDVLPDARVLVGFALQRQKKFAEAIEAWQDYLTRHPAHAAWSQVQSAIVGTEFLMGAEARRAKKYDEARRLWQAFMVKHPLDTRLPAIMLEFGLMHHEQSDYEAAIADWSALVSKYPASEEASHAQYLIGMTHEEKLGSFDDALAAYRKLNWGSFAPRAQQRVTRLSRQELGVATERVFRSNQTPKIRVTTRNIQSLAVRAYRVDLETYFRKMHLARGVEALDIGLIDPDKTWVFEVPDYAEHAEQVSTIEIPLDGPGVMAVTVSNEPKPAEPAPPGITVLPQEATTMVIQSDLDVLVKCSRNELFVFAENMRTTRPMPAVRLLVSDGARVFAEAVTGADGVFVAAVSDEDHTYDPLRTSNDIRVFAVAEPAGRKLIPAPREPAGGSQDAPAAAARPADPQHTPDDSAGAARSDEKDHDKRPPAEPAETAAAPRAHFASSIVGLEGIEFAQGVSARAYLYTDRPAYRAGQLVHVRGVVRWVKGDEYFFEAGKKLKLDVYDSRARRIRSEDVALDDFGAVASRFVLPPDSPQGEYRLHLHDPAEPARHNYEGSFTVHEYRLEPVQIVIDTPRRVYYRGEEVSGTIRLRYYYGPALRGREVRYTLPDGAVQTATTDDSGEVPFRFDTREFSEDQMLPIRVQYPEQNLQTGLTIFLATRAFRASIATARPVFIAGETFDASVTTTDAAGQKIGEKMTLAVVERTEVEGQVGERTVEEHDVKTDKETGEGRVTLHIAHAGTYVLRASGTDRFGNPVSAATEITVSGDEDSVRLRILADRHLYQAGDVARVQVHWRENRALALVTYQGARVLGYRLVELATGKNELEIPMAEKLAPNFDLTVSVMTDSGARAAGPARADRPAFHEATSPFEVERPLRVTLTPNRQRPRPGEELELSITTTDPQGKPVPAELSIALVEKSLLEMFPDQRPQIAQFFEGAKRSSALRTVASCTFEYAPKTRRISDTLVAEAERVAVQEMERLGREAGALGAVALGMTEGAMRAEDAESLASELSQEVRRALEAMDGVDAHQVYPTADLMIAAPAAGGGGLNSVDADGSPSAKGPPGGALGGLGGRYRANWSSVLSETDAMFGTMLDPRGADMQDQPAMMAKERAANRPESAAYGYIVLDQDRLRAYARNLGGDTKAGKQSGRQLGIVLDDGSLNFFDAGLVASGKIKKLAKLESAVVLTDYQIRETGYWNPRVVTDEKGKATLRFTVPDRSTAWQLNARGVTSGTLTGQATAEVVAKKDLFGELKLPAAFVEGDAAQILARVHNDAVENGTIEVTLRTTIGGKTRDEKRSIPVTAQGEYELTFERTITGTEDAVFELSIRLAGAKNEGEDKKDSEDVVRAIVPVRPYGIPVYATAGGTASANVTTWLAPPAGMPLGDPSLQILVGASVERSLLDAVLGSDGIAAAVYRGGLFHCESALERSTSDILASIGLLELVARTRDKGSPEAAALAERVRASISLVVSSQNDDGGWSWTGAKGPSDRGSSARTLWALTLARKAGFAVPDDAYAKAVAFVQTAFTAARENDYDAKALLLHALTVAGHGDFAYANRLYRSRAGLSRASLAYLALAFAEMDRKEIARELLGLLEPKAAAAGPAAAPGKADERLQGSQDAEVRALYLLALDRAAPGDAQAREAVEWLMAQRHGVRWQPERATGPAVLALSAHFGEARFAETHYKLAVFVNDERVAELDMVGAAGTQTIGVPRDLLQRGEKLPQPGDARRQRINFELTGRGRFTFSCVLAGSVPADAVKSTETAWHLNRTFEPAPLELDGREIPRGFDILTGSFNTWRNPVSELPVGRRASVHIDVARNRPRTEPSDTPEYLVVTEPIPSGVTVLEPSITGSFERYEIEPGAITFYLGTAAPSSSIAFDVYGYTAGKYRAAPTTLRSFYAPERMAVTKPSALAVLPTGQASKDEYRLTPRELYELGKRWLDKKEYPKAADYLTKLFDAFQLKPEIYKEVAVMLLRVSLETRQAPAIVRYFEVLKEKYPDLELPFDDIVRVGAAYRAMNEYERGYLVFRATAEGSFARESEVAGFLQSEGEFQRSVSVMDGILREYPAEPYIAAATYALAQQIYATAARAADDARLREKRITRVDLIREAIRRLDSFLTVWPDDPAADQAGFSIASGLVELEAWPDAIERSDRFARRFPDSRYLDSFWYIIGYSHFAKGEHAEAIDMCRRVAETVRNDPATGREKESQNKWRAIYILGQIHHALGESADAIREYGRVADRFPDARETIEYFTRKAIELPEVTTLRPGEDAQVDLKFRNVAECELKVYRIDLVKFGLVERDLSHITRINLAGIRPLHEAKVELGDGKDYRDRSTELELAVHDEGAYLVVCRGEDLYTSGLVLVTPLVIDVQEEPASGRVRATLRNAVTESYSPDVHVKVIGTRNPAFKAGQTDLRGVFVADGIRGRTTVIARAGEARYAFHRGQLELGPAAPSAGNAPAEQKAAAPEAAKPGGAQQDLLEDLFDSNRAIQEQNVGELKKLYDRKQRGVQIQQAY